MTLPKRIDAAWIGHLSDAALLRAERELSVRYVDEERRERSRVGDAYDVLSGPESLASSWLRWWMVRQAGATRGLAVGH